MNNEGTISWFEISKDLMPPQIEGWIGSDNVLVCHMPSGKVAIGRYMMGGTTPFWALGSGLGYDQPTHWAFINIPQKQQS